MLSCKHLLHFWWVVLLVLAGNLYGQNLSLDSATAINGRARLTLSLNASNSSPIAAVQWTLAYSQSSITSVAATVGPTATTAGKTVQCALTSAGYSCILAGMNRNPIPSGAVANVDVTLAAGQNGATIQVVNTLGASGDGAAVQISGSSGAIT